MKPTLETQTTGNRGERPRSRRGEETDVAPADYENAKRKRSTYKCPLFLRGPHARTANRKKNENEKKGGL